jgi:hypothetical protein
MSVGSWPDMVDDDGTEAVLVDLLVTALMSILVLKSFCPWTYEPTGD